MSPDGKEVVVGAKNGVVRIYTFNPKDHKMKLKTVFRDAKSWVSDIKFGYNTLIIGSHDDSIYVYNY
jgi:WD40 repeat protein